MRHPASRLRRIHPPLSRQGPNFVAAQLASKIGYRPTPVKVIVLAATRENFVLAFSGVDLTARAMEKALVAGEVEVALENGTVSGDMQMVITANLCSGSLHLSALYPLFVHHVCTRPIGSAIDHQATQRALSIQ